MKSLADFKRLILVNKFFFLLVALLCLGAYFNSLGGGFVSDDIESIVENPRLGDFSLILRRPSAVIFLQGLIFHLFGRSVFAYHAANLILHILVTFLVYFFVLILTADDRLSTLTSLLFALHPIHTEAVSWISGGPYVLYSFFFLLSFILYHFYLEGGRKISYLLSSLLCYLLAIFSNIWAFPPSIAYFLYEKYLRAKKINWVFYLVLVAAAGFSLFLSFRLGVVAGKVAVGASVGGTKDPTITIPFSLTQYLYLLFWPLNLSIYHEGLKISLTYVWLSRAASVLVVFVLPLILFLRKAKLPLFFLLFFLSSISLSLSPIKIGWYVAERYLYLGSISFCVLIASLLLWLEKKLPIKNLALFLLIPILLLYSVRIFIRNEDWQTPSSFWVATAKASPTSFRAYNNLGIVYGWQENWDKAIEAYKKSLKIKPEHDTANFNLGIAYFAKGNLEAAKKSFLKATQINPKYHRAFYNLGLIYYKEGNLEEARKSWEQVLKIDPGYTDARKALNALESEGL